VCLVDPHEERVVGVENEASESLGVATRLDQIANIGRTRHKLEPAVATSAVRSGPNLVELAHARHYDAPGV